MFETLIPPSDRSPAQAVHHTPRFPYGGLLPKTPMEVAANLRRQREVERQAWCDARVREAAAGRAAPSQPCVKALNISLFFDGTNNHEPADSKARPPTTTNVARLYHATLGREGNEKQQSEGYYRYYMQGVGTEFKEIREYKPVGAGLTMATGGEKRINWGLTRLIDAVGQACDKPPLTVESAYALVEAMGTGLVTEVLTGGQLDGNARRKAALQKDLQELEQALKQRHEQGSGAEIKALRLFVYGFSRGAAEARCFANWLEQLTRVEENGVTRHLFAGLPISIVFMGLFDTVASVGFAYLAPFAAGHMGWADDTMRLPDSTTFLQRCVHLAAAHEQRGCFPLDSIRRKDDRSNPKSPSRYRDGTYEYVYPGVHSDVGGGYPPGDQGKAREGGQSVLSQIALHHMYDEAFKAGAPLQVPPLALDKDQPKWLEMSPETQIEFAISESLVDRFNNWQKQLSRGPIEDVLDRELEVLTGWRIDRFVHESLYRQAFYQHVSGDKSQDMTEAERDAFKHLHELQLEEDAVARGDRPTQRHYRSEEERILAERRAAEKKAEAERIKAEYERRTESGPIKFNTHKEFEPMLDGRQLKNGALDFKRDYEGRWNLGEGDGTGESGMQTASILNAMLGGLIYLLNEQDEAEEYKRMRTHGTEHHERLFVGVDKPADESAALLIKLFDDQVHDSRAWFMNSNLNGREVFSDYFRYRAVFFDDESSKRLSLLVQVGQVIGVAVATASIGLAIKRRDPRYLLGIFLPSLGTQVLRGKVGMPEITAFDSLTGVTLPMLEGLEAVRAFTKDTGSVVELAKALPVPPPLSEQTATTPELASILKAHQVAQAAKEAKESKDTGGLLGTLFENLDANPVPASTKKPGWLEMAGKTLETLGEGN